MGPRTSKGKTREQHERVTRAALLDATESLFAEFGHDGLTNRAIAERAGTTTQPIYTFFGGHDALVQAMYDRAINGFADILTASIHPGLAGAASQVSLWKNAALLYRSYCKNYPGRFRLVVEAPKDGAPDTTELQERLLDELTTLSHDGSGSSDKLRARLRVSISAINGFIAAEQQEIIDLDLAEELFLELVFRLSVDYDIVERGVGR